MIKIKRKLQTLRDSFYINIPIAFIQILKWNKGEKIEVDIDLRGNSIVLKKVKNEK